MKVGIFGYGTVGQAVGAWFKDAYIYDIKGYEWEEEKVKKLQVIFICVSTPTNKYTQNIDAIRDCLTKIKDLNIDPIIIIKSSILPGTTNKLYNEFNLKLVHSPEFLSEKTAVKDFEHQEFVYLGYPDSMCCEDMMKTDVKLRKLFDDFKVVSSLAKTMELTKYAANCFYATKVTYFNSIYKICEDMKICYDDVRRLIVKSTGWMNEMHTNVPGRHGLGYAGRCFPDNMKAFSQMNDFVKFVDDYNEELRRQDVN